MLLAAECVAYLLHASQTNQTKLGVDLALPAKNYVAMIELGTPSNNERAKPTLSDTAFRVVISRMFAFDWWRNFLCVVTLRADSWVGDFFGVCVFGSHFVCICTLQIEMIVRHEKPNQHIFSSYTFFCVYSKLG